MYWEIQLKSKDLKDKEGETIFDGTVAKWIVPFHRSTGVFFEAPIRGDIGFQVHGWNFNLATSRFELPSEEKIDGKDS